MTRRIGKAASHSRAPVWIALMLAIASAFTAPATVLAAPVIMVLQSRAQGENVQAKIEAIPDIVTSPFVGKLSPKWVVLPGQAIASAQRPADRVVHLFRKVGLQQSHICSINLRYYPDKEGAWIPHFQMDEQPAVVRRNGRWVPIKELQGISSLIVLTSSTLPNAEGFYPSLEFGLTVGMTSIDAWIVR
jgi:hypothetical protein